MLDYSYFKEHYKMIKIDLSKQQALNIHRKAIQQINFTGNLNRDKVTAMFLIIEEAKENHFRIFTRISESIKSLFSVNVKNFNVS